MERRRATGTHGLHLLLVYRFGDNLIGHKSFAAEMPKQM